MLTLEQVRKLEARVSAALGYIDRLSSENAALRQRLSGYEGRIKDLEVLVRDFQQDQSRIEEGILHALKKLDAFEDAVIGAGTESKAGADAKAAPGAGAKAGGADLKSAGGSKLIRSVEPDKGGEAEIEEAEEILEEEDTGPLDRAEKGATPADLESGELDIF